MLLSARAQYIVDRVRRTKRALADVADEREVIFPESERTAPRANYLDGMLDRVKGLQLETTSEQEDVRLRGGRTLHRATVRYLFKDAVLVGGDLYVGGVRQPLRPNTRRSSLFTPAFERVEEASVVQTYEGSCYFGHWLLDDRPMHTLGVTYAPPVAVPIPMSVQQREYLKLFDQAPPQALDGVRVKALHVFDDIGQNVHRQERLETLRARFQKTGTRSGHVVFICRGDAGVKRLLKNEAAIAEYFEKRGAVIIRRPEALPLDELAEKIGRAQIVVGLDSSALGHAILGIKTGGGLLVISPADRFNNTFKDWCDSLGLHYGVVIADKLDDGYVVQEQDIARTIDLLVAAPSSC